MPRLVGAVALAGIVGIVGQTFLRDGGSATLAPASAAETTTRAERTRPSSDGASTSAPTTEPGDGPSRPPATQPDRAAPASTPSGQTRRAATSTTTTTTTTPAPPTTAAPTAPPVTSAAPGGADLGYPASPDGSPLPVIVVYGTDEITVTGAVPSQAAKDRLGALALANSQNEAALANDLIVNDRVPISVGVRVIELNSPRFPDGSAELLPEHAQQFDRVAAVMKALPNVTALVIGHADQRGDDLNNLKLSDARARAAMNYLTYLGIEPTRLSSRAAGESDLLTLNDDDVSLALNRRTEFIFYGVLLD